MTLTPTVTPPVTRLEPVQSVQRPAATRLVIDPPALTPAQQRVMALVSENPGQTIRQLTKPLGSSHATVTYHLALLVRRGLLVRERDGREVRHFVANAGRSTQYIEALNREPRKRAILVLLASQKTNLSINHMARQLGLPFGFLKRTLIALERQGLVRLESRSFRYSVHVEPALLAFKWD